MPKVVSDQNELIPTAKYPYANFPFEHFNPVQSRAFDMFESRDNVLVAAATSSGKAQPDDTPVLTPHGYRLLKNISIGDSVVGGDGLPTTVVGVYPQGTKKVFEVSFSDGSKTRCCEEHLWAVQTRSQRSRGENFSVKSLGEVMLDPVRRYHIPQSPVVQFAEAKLGLHPYVLGLLLGDGGVCHAAKVTISDAAVKEKFTAHLPTDMTLKQHNGSKPYDYFVKGDGRINSVWYELNQLGLSGLKSYEKFVPPIYLHSSECQRRDLLAGLMDSDGGFSNNNVGCAEYNTSSWEMAKNVEFLVRSLGGWTRIRKKSRCTYKYKGELREGRPCYRMTVSMGDYNPFGAGKRYDLFAKNRSPSERQKLRTIVGYKETNAVECRCIKVANEDGLYITEDMIVTHNTVTAEMFLAQEIRENRKKGLYLSPLRSLALEKNRDWRDPDYHFADLKVCICTGDFRLTPQRRQEVEESDMLILTSEMLNSRSRNCRAENNQFLKDIGTCVIDECFSEDSVVITDRGEMTIGDLADQSPNIKVLSCSLETGDKEFRRVVSSQKKLLPREWVTLTYDGGSVQVTSNQLLHVNGRYVPAHEVKTGDFLTFHATPRQLDDDERRKTTGAWFTVGGRVGVSDGKKQDGSEVCRQSFDQTIGTRTVEVRKIETTGVQPACQDTQRRLRRFHAAIHDGLVSRNERNPPLGQAERKKNGDARVVEPNPSPACFSVLADGRWESSSENHVFAHRGFFSSRERTSAKLADLEMGNRCKNPTLKEIPVSQNDGGRSRQILRSDSIICHTQHGVQSGATESVGQLSLLWQAVLDFERCEKSIESCSVLRRSELLSCAEQVLLRLEQESVCCDIEVEENNNFFVKRTGKDFVLAHNSHLLGVPGRGDHLENGLIKFTEINPDCRFVLLSATLPNVEEVADWIGKLTGRDTTVIRSQYRPCPLTIHFPTYRSSQSYDETENAKIDRGLAILEKFPNDKFIFFVHSKRTGDNIMKRLNARKVKSAFHNADLVLNKREEVEAAFRDGDMRVLVATSTLAWGLNLPSRRVVIVGVHRGRDEVETYDILQMCGRSGRPRYDPAGDAYVLVPDMQSLKHKERIQNPPPLKSQLTGVNALAFHIVSEIHHRACRTVSEVEEWYKRTFVFQQRGFAGLGDLHDAVSRLETTKCVKIDGDQIEVTGVGAAASMYYYPPFDAAALYRNFKKLFTLQDITPQAIAFALSCVPSYYADMPTVAEQPEVNGFAEQMAIAKAHRMFSDAPRSGEARAALCYYRLMHNDVPSTPSLAAAARTLKVDFDRVSELLQTLDSLAGKWDKEEFFQGLRAQVVHGVERHLVDLVRLDGVGPAKAKKLYENGLCSLSDIVSKPTAVAPALKCKADVAEKLVKQAQLLLLGGNAA